MSWVHSSVARAADCRSAGPWFKSGCALSPHTTCKPRGETHGRFLASSTRHMLPHETVEWPKRMCAGLWRHRDRAGAPVHRGARACVRVYQTHNIPSAHVPERSHACYPVHARACARTYDGTLTPRRRALNGTRAFTNTCTHKCDHTDKHTRTRARACTPARSRAPALAGARARARVRAGARTHTHSYVHTHIHTHTHAHTHTHTHTVSLFLAL